MNYKFRTFHIPDRMMASLKRYIEQGVKPGGFLTAVIDNDLKEACERADDENLVNLPAFVAYFYNEAPRICWGSPEKRREWIRSKHEKAQTTPTSATC